MSPLHKSSSLVPIGKLRFRAKLNFSISPTLENFLEIQKCFLKNLKKENNKTVKWNIQRLTSLFMLIWYSCKRGLSSMVCDELLAEIRRLTSLFILIWYSGKRGLSSMVCDELTEIRRLTSLLLRFSLLTFFSLLKLRCLLHKFQKFSGGSAPKPPCNSLLRSLPGQATTQMILAPGVA